MGWIVAFLLAIVPAGDGTVHDEFDVLEVNHVLDEWASPVFDQIIFWRWDAVDCWFRCHGWVMMRGSRDKSDAKHKAWFRQNLPACCWDKAYKGKFVGGSMSPTSNYRLERYELRYTDKGTRRLITAPIMRETWTQYDRERRDEKVFPEDLRRGLTRSGR